MASTPVRLLNKLFAGSEMPLSGLYQGNLPLGIMRVDPQLQLNQRFWELQVRHWQVSTRKSSSFSNFRSQVLQLLIIASTWNI